MSSFQQTSLSITVEDPLIKTNRTLHQRLTDQVERYKQEIRAIGGYYSARITINDNQGRIEDWIQDGSLGRHIVTHDLALNVIWEGFVNKITANLGNLQFIIGPLVDIANRVSVVYSTIDTTVSPPVIGSPAITAVANDTDSQALYGIIEKVVNSPPASSTEAEQLRDTFLADNAFPRTSRRSNLSGTSDPSVILNCLGYWHWTDTYTYSNASTGQHNLSDKLIAIRDDEPNGSIFSSDDSKVTANTIQVQQEESGEDTGLSLLEELNSIGDVSNNRYNIGFYQDRQLVYVAAPTSIKYQQRIAGNREVTNLLGSEINPWNVLASEWLFYPDFLVGRLPPITEANLRQDPRAGYIEVIRFDAPWGLTVNSEKFGETDQILAKLGLRGFG